jgi:predicted transcriptional regulator
VSIEIERLVAEEAAASEANPDAPIPVDSSLSRPNRARSTVYSIRLNPEEVAEVQALADAARLPASTLVRSWIIDRIRAEHGELSDAEAELRAVQRHLAHLERHLRQHVA